MPRLRCSEIARVVGVHKSTVSRQVRDWGLVGPDGLIDEDEYRARRERELNPLLSRRVATPAPAADAAPSVSSAAATLKQRQAEMLELRLAREQGQQLDAAEVASAIGEAGALLKALLAAVPSKVAVRLAGMTDPEGIETLLAAAHNQVLADFGAAMESALTGEDEDAGGA